MKHFISLGAGVQSSTIALMAACGEITPMPEGAIFADTQAEPKPVYEWLDWLEQRLPFPVHRVTAGNLAERAARLHTSAKGRAFYDIEIPVYIDARGEKTKQIPRRECTRDFKVRPIEKALRRLAGIKRGTTEASVELWIGISFDEFHRMKDSPKTWILHRWPLVQMRMTRSACLAWMERKGYPEPPRSACVFCPFRSNAEWRHLSMTDPQGFASAVAFDASLREHRPGNKAYVHRSLKPLDEVDLRNDVDRGQLLLWQDECTGMCGV